MSGYLLDTAVLLSVAQGAPWGRANRCSAQLFLQRALHKGWALHLSVATLARISRRAAVLRSGRHYDAECRLAQWVERLRHTYPHRLLSLDDEIAVVWGRLLGACGGRSDAAQLAATAIVHGLQIVTSTPERYTRLGASVHALPAPGQPPAALRNP